MTPTDTIGSLPLPTTAQLIRQAIVVNHKQVKRETAAEYAAMLEHFAGFLGSLKAPTTLTAASRTDVMLFLSHLEEPGGGRPGPLRAECSWCELRGFPAGKDGKGCSPSYRKRHLAALRFFYFHCIHEAHLPTVEPTLGILAPRVVVRPQYRPDRDDVRALLDAPGHPRDRLLAHWIFYAPSRRQTFVDALWSDLDLDAGTWFVVGKGDRPDTFDLHPLLLRELRNYHRWQREVQAADSPAVADALRDPQTAYVLLSRNGRKCAPSLVSKMLKWRAVRAGVGVTTAVGPYDTPGGKTSRMSAHALRRAWAHEALNDPVNPQPLDVVSQVLKHKDTATTRLHYAATKPERARSALTGFHL